MFNLAPFRVHYLVGGRGQPLVLVHGLDGRAENWARLMPALMCHGHRVYAIDLLGFGRSDRPDVDYSIALQAEVLNQFFDSQGLARADLGGWSMGGWVTLKFALTIRNACAAFSWPIAPVLTSSFPLTPRSSSR